MSFGRALQRNRGLSYLFAITLGVASGFYLFNEPLKQYFEEQGRLYQEQQAAKAEAAAPAATPAAEPAAKTA